MGAKTFAYNQNNRLISASENGSTLGEYTHNGFGQRTIKTVGGKTTIFHYDRLGNIISEETQGEELIRDYIHIGRNRIAMVESTRCLADIDTDHDVDGADLALLADDYNRTDCSEASPCSADINGNGVVNADDLSILASEFGKTLCPEDKFYYFHNNHLGTPQRVTDQDGAIVWSANYVPFGEATVTLSTISNPFRFPGQYFDNETGLHYNYFRYYEPGVGRYLRPDPINFLLSNLFSNNEHFSKLYFGVEFSDNYTYSRNNVKKLSDFFGLYVGGYGLGGILAIGGKIMPGSVGTGSILFVSDDKGNFGFVECYGAGLASGAGFLVGIQTSHLWGIKSICDMERNGFLWGVSLGYASGEGISGEIGKSGVNILTGAGVGKWGATTNILKQRSRNQNLGYDPSTGSGHRPSALRRAQGSALL